VTRYDVAFYTPWIGPLLVPDRDVAPTGGAETQVLLVARALAARGFRVCVIAFALDGVRLPAHVAGVDVIARPPYGARRRLIGKLVEAAHIWGALRSVDAGVVVTRAAGPHVGLVGLFARISGKRFVYSSANVSDFNFAVLAPKRRDRALLRLGIRLANEVVVQSDEQVFLCRRKFGRTPRLIRSVCEPAPPRAGTREAFLWIGRMVWYKRPEAFLELAKATPEARFWLVGVPVPWAPGGAQLLADVEREARALPNLELLSPRPRAELMELIGRAVAIVNTADFEGVPNILLEGWARGVQALVLTHDPDQMVERERLGAFAHGDAATLAAEARRMWAQRDEQQEVAAHCRRHVRQNHAADAIAARWAEALALDPTPAVDRPLAEAV
jgi:glycosyltransferase involved in cell wall biosynthesis